jgi:hypothetical protein
MKVEIALMDIAGNEALGFGRVSVEPNTDGWTISSEAEEVKSKKVSVWNKYALAFPAQRKADMVINRFVIIVDGEQTFTGTINTPMQVTAGMSLNFAAGALQLEQDFIDDA